MNEPAVSPDSVPTSCFGETQYFVTDVRGLTE